MTRATSTSSRLLISIALSLLLHMLAAVTLAHIGADAADRAMTLEKSAEKPRPNDTTLGLKKSRAATINWLGAETPTEHHAEQADVEQPAFTRAATAPAPMPPTPAVTSAAPAPAAADLAPTEDASPEEPSPIDLAQLPLKPAPDLIPNAPARLHAQLETAMGPPAPEDTATPERDATPKPIEDKARPADADDQSPSQTSDTSTKPEQASPSSEPAEPGLPSDKESQAFALEKPIKWRPGQPAAAEGLEIKTVRPRWSTFIQLTAAPRNPRVIIKFRRDGAVHSVDLIRSSGSRPVDGPLIDALYNWIAEGEPLNQLPETAKDAPPATLAVEIWIDLVG